MNRVCVHPQQAPQKLHLLLWLLLYHEAQGKGGGGREEGQISQHRNQQPPTDFTRSAPELGELETGNEEGYQKIT